MEKINMNENNERRILLIEDNHLNLRIMSRLLQSMDINVVGSSSGKKAIKHAVDEKFSMIFMCVFMPEVVGYDTSKKIRDLSVINKDTPIIAVSSFGYKKVNDKMKESGINEIISKPLNKDELTDLFEKYPVGKTDIEYKIFNKNEFELFYNEDDLKKKIISTFISERDSDLSRIKKAFKSKDIDVIYDALHYMKGSFTYLKAKSILELTQKILNLLIDKKLNEVLLLEKTFNEKYDLLIEELNFYITEI